MALILQQLSGRPYHAHVPERLSGEAATQFASFHADFAALDRRLAAVAPLEATQFRSVLADALSSAGLFDCSEETHQAATSCLFRAAQQVAADPTGTPKSLKAANALLCQSVGKGIVRTGPMWVGAAHPADAWYVAPPAAHVHALLRDLFRFTNDRKWPLTLRACVAMQQLLDIHPFSDGNGRTARALLLGMLVQRWGLQQGFVSALAGFWAERGLRRHAATYQIRASGDWSAFLQMSLALGWGCRLAPTATKECNTGQR